VPPSREAPETTSILPSRRPQLRCSALNFPAAIVLYVSTPQMPAYRQAAACPRAAKKRRRSEVSVPHSGSAGAVGRHNKSRIGPRSAKPASTRCRTRAVIRKLQTRRSQSTKEPEWWRTCPASISCATTLRSAFDWRRKPALQDIDRFSSKWPTAGLRSPSTPKRLKKDSPGQAIAESA
jgi:hypothetical protein